MNLRRTSVRALVAAGAAGALILGLVQPAPAAAARGDDRPQLETLDRGLVAVSTADGRVPQLAPARARGRTGDRHRPQRPSFAVFRDGERIATVDDSTNYADPDGTATSVYTVAPAWHDVDRRADRRRDAWPNGYYDLPLQKPADGVTPAGEAYTYSANDAPSADVDGDGAYEFVVKWDPSNSKDVSQKGYTGPVYVDTYEFDGTLLNRIDLGVNIRAGAHYTQFMVYDFDGDGRSETMLKTAPGTKSISYAPTAASGAESSSRCRSPTSTPAYAHDDDYRLSAAGLPRAPRRDVPGLDGASRGRGRQLARHARGGVGHPGRRTSTRCPRRMPRSWPTTSSTSTRPTAARATNCGTFEGFIIDGPEYLTVFDSATGEELQTVAYEPGRGDDGLLWGDYALSRIEPANRVDRFLAGVAYLDGTHPSAIFARGYYTRTTVAAYDWDGESLSQRWFVDSGHVPMTNPFNDSPHGRDGTDPEYGTITTQGFHSLSAADVDGDGKHEIVYGSATLDDDGGLLYSSFDVLPEGSAAPGESVRLGHGDAMHVTDIDPNRPGLEIWTAHEGATFAPYGSAMRDAATGEVLFGAYSGRDTGRSMIGDVRTDVPGIEVWASMPGGTEASGLLERHRRAAAGRRSRERTSRSAGPPT